MTQDLKPEYWQPVPWCGCWIWTGGLNSNGMRAQMRYGGRPINAARAFYAHYRGPIPPGMWVLHRCDNALCVNPDHLYLGDCKQNNSDTRIRGRHFTPWKGSTAKRKLSLEQLSQIVLRLSQGEPATIISKEYGVAPSTIKNIRHGTTYRRDVALLKASTSNEAL